MFFFFPVGHDRSVFGLPHLTMFIIAACTVIFCWTWGRERSAIGDAEATQGRALALLQQHPGACVDFTLSGLPDTFLDVLTPPQCPPGHVLTDADRALIGMTREVIAHVNRVPMLRLGYRPGSPSVGTLFSSMWLHGGLFHLFGNMVFLFLAGSVIESFWGPARFFVLYMLSGIGGTLLHHVMNQGDLSPMIGASGAISGCLGAFVVLYPRTKIQMGYLIFLLVYVRRGIFLMPAWLAIPLWAVQQILGAALGADDGIAYGAHIGGFVVGALGGLLAFILGFGAVPEPEERPQPTPPAQPLPSSILSSRPSLAAPPRPSRAAEFPDGIPLDLDLPEPPPPSRD